MKRLFAFLSLVVALLLVTQTAEASTILDQTTDAFRVAADTFGHRIKIYGLQLLAVLAVIQIALTMQKVLIAGGGLEEVAKALLFANVMPFGFFLFAIYSSETILPSIISTFDFIGQKGSGLDQLTPSVVMTQGIDVQQLMVKQFNEVTGTGLIDAIKNFAPSLILTGCCFIVLISFGVLAAQMALALISGYFWVAVTPFILGFGGVSFTRDIAVGALKGGIAIGMKILCVYLVAGVATELAPVMGNGMGQVTLTDWSPLFWVSMTSMILAYLSFQLPKLASDLMNGTASLSAGDAGTNMAAAAAMTAGGGVAAASVAGGAANAILSAASAGLAGSGNSLSGAAASRLEAGASAGSSAGSAVASVAPPAGGLRGGGMPSGRGYGPAVLPSASSSTSGSDGGASYGAVAPPASGAASQGGAVGGSEASSFGSGTSSNASPPSSSLGDASGASLSGTGGQTQDSKGASTLERAASAYSKVMEHQQAVPQDSHTVGLSASLSHRAD